MIVWMMINQQEAEPEFFLSGQMKTGTFKEKQK